ncbi:hypothetical protein KKA13_02950 [Patescibacteria group bacterium]|nr:hypothetical protein [Patescibacteria group bacterium]
MKKAIATIITLAIMGLPVCSRSEMNSASYTIYADSVNTGGILSTGGAFSMEDTIGESPVGIITGGVYETRGGYQAMVSSSIYMTISSTSLNLGELSASSVSAVSTTVEITTNAEDGYVLSVGSLTGTSISAVSDGAVTAGAEEYGLSATGFDSLIMGDVGITNGLNISVSGTPVTSVSTILGLKASISPATTPGARSQNISLVASANL